MTLLKVLDLFSGIGGFSLGLERAGMETVAFCEIEDYPVRILNKHWPDVPVYRDVRKLNGKQYRNKIDVVCGGFPCQPFSVAGKQKGKEDDRHLWPEMLRIIKESKPTWVIGENVAGFIKMALDDVLLDLETEGYTTQSFVIPACAVGAVHRRDRVWVIAYADRQIESIKPIDDKKRQRVSSNPKHHGRNGSKNRQSDSERDVCNTPGPNKAIESTRSSCARGDDADSKSVRRDERFDGVSAEKNKESGVRIKTGAKNKRLFQKNCEFKPIRLPIESPICHRDDGVPERVARLKSLGNAVVPQIPEVIGRAIIKIR